MNDDTLDCWEAEARERQSLKSDSTLELRMRILTLIKLVRKKDADLSVMVNLTEVLQLMLQSCDYSIEKHISGHRVDYHTLDNAPIFFTTTPYTMNGPYNHIIKPRKKGMKKPSRRPRS